MGTYNEHEEKEGIEVIVSTKDMPRDKMVEAQVWSWFINTFHINGITSYISRFLYKHNDIEYKDFYENLFSFISKDEWFSKEIHRITEHYANWTMHGKIDHEPIQGMEIHGWNLIHSTVINLHAENKHSHVIGLLEKFLNETYDLPAHLVDQLVNLQRLFLIDYNDIANYRDWETDRKSVG